MYDKMIVRPLILIKWCQIYTIFMQKENVFIFFDKGNITTVYQNCII